MMGVMIEPMPTPVRAMDRARPRLRSIRAAKGCRKAEMHRGIENPDSFILLAEWDTLEDHMVGFRESAAFTEWRAILGPHFASPPAVEHSAAPGWRAIR